MSTYQDIKDTIFRSKTEREIEAARGWIDAAFDLNQLTVNQAIKLCLKCDFKSDLIQTGNGNESNLRRLRDGANQKTKFNSCRKSV